MRRVILQARRIGIEGEVLPRYLDVVLETMGDAYPELRARRDEILTWIRAEEEGFGRTLQQGEKRFNEAIESRTFDGKLAFELHDTFGFPFELVVEMFEERVAGGAYFMPDGGMARVRDDFENEMTAQRERSRAASRLGDHGGAAAGSIAAEVAAEPTRFVGYETLEQHTTVAGVLERDGRTFVKLAESPFYAEGGGQVSDAGTIVLDAGAGELTVASIVRAGDDQAIVVAADGDAPALTAGQSVTARVNATARHATECNHTATHLLHAALRERLGDHVHQAGSAVRPDKLRFDFNHPTRLDADDVRWVEDRVNGQILANQRVRALSMPLDEAKALGAQALFGEKYGDIVRMVEIGDGNFSRELCGGTHVRSTAEIGVFRIVSEGSSAANVRRIEAVTGPVAIEQLVAQARTLEAAAAAARVPVDQLPERVEALREQVKAAKAAPTGPAVDEAALAAEATTVDDVPVVVARLADGISAKDLPAIADRVKGKLGAPGVVVLAAPADGKVGLIVAVAPEIVARGVKAGDVVKAAAAAVGGGGGGKPTMAQAGGRDPEKTDDALRVAANAISVALTGL